MRSYALSYTQCLTIRHYSWYGRGPGRVTVKHGTFLKDIDMFDNVEFGISNKDAQAMSPSTRKLIELSFLSLLDAGIPYRSRNIGCFASGTNFDIVSVTEPVCNLTRCGMLLY